MNESFDVAIVGAGPAGIAAACTLADAGLRTVVFERGEFPGAKNVSGGVLYGHDLARVLPDYLESLDVPYHVIRQDTYSVVRRVIPEGRTQCGLCSRLRRGALYRYARENGFTRIALGHHRDDIIETLFLNLFHGGRLKAMPPKLRSDDGQNVVIRPLCYVAEREIARYTRARGFPIIPCTLCGSQPNLQREAIARMLEDWERASPGRVESIFNAICNVEASHLADPGAFDFGGLERVPAGPGG